MLSGTSSAETPAPLDLCWAVVQDVERAPEWQGGLEAVEVLERDPEGRPLVCDTVTDARFTKVRARVRFEYAPPGRLVWKLVSPEDLDALEGAWELEDLGAHRRVTYSLALDPGPIGRLARPLERMLRPLIVGGRARELVGELARRG